jgi:hypothetical protein
VTDDLDLEQRLRDLGEAPLDPSVSDSHRLAMARVGAEGGGHRPRFGWKAVAAAAVTGFLVGSSGLAAAGALPDPAQDVAHDVLDAVGIDVPRSTEGCPEGTSYRNHGEYVSSVEAAGGDVEAAAKSDCGKPSKASGKGKGNGNGGAKVAGEPRADEDGDPCTGPPPWAGAHLTPEEKAAAQAAREATCGPDEDAAGSDTEEDGAEQREAPVPDETTTTTESPETTTSAPETTTTAPDSTTTTGS